MRLPTVESLMRRYLSFFSIKVIDDDQELKDKIFKWIDRDLKWASKQIKKDAVQASGNRKVIFDWKGSGRQLKRALSLRK